MSFAYPQTVEAEAALLVVYKHVTGTLTLTTDLVNACWVLTGYGLSLGLPVNATASIGEPYCELAKALAFVGEPRTNKLGDGTLLKLIPWKIVGPLLLQLLTGLLAGK